MTPLVTWLVARLYIQRPINTKLSYTMCDFHSEPKIMCPLHSKHVTRFNFGFSQKKKREIFISFFSDWVDHSSCEKAVLHVCKIMNSLFFHTKNAIDVPLSFHQPTGCLHEFHRTSNGIHIELDEGLHVHSPVAAICAVCSTGQYNIRREVVTFRQIGRTTFAPTDQYVQLACNYWLTKM